jgi:hypothetical protein
MIFFFFVYFKLKSLFSKKLFNKFFLYLWINYCYLTFFVITKIKILVFFFFFFFKIFTSKPSMII